MQGRDARHRQAGRELAPGMPAPSRGDGIAAGFHNPRLRNNSCGFKITPAFQFCNTWVLYKARSPKPRFKIWENLVTHFSAGHDEHAMPADDLRIVLGTVLRDRPAELQTSELIATTRGARIFRAELPRY